MQDKHLFVVVISPLIVSMIDRHSKLKDHVNISIMEAVQVDESKDTLWESHICIMDSDPQ